MTILDPTVTKAENLAFAPEHKFTTKQLIRVLEDHYRWHKSDGKSGRQACIQNAVLQNINLDNKVKLCGAVFTETDLSGSKLPGADLQNVKFTKN